MKQKKYKLTYISLSTLVLIAPITFADTEQMHTTLARIDTILTQINPLINLAKQQEDPNTRVKFQFEALRQDISLIQSGIGQALNRVSIQPRTVAPLVGDYLPRYPNRNIEKLSTTTNEHTQ